MAVYRDISEHKEAQDALQKELRYKEKLQEMNRLELRKQQIIAESPQILTLLEKALTLSNLNKVNILITGGSGTGKNILARFIHQNSLRKKQQ